MSTSFSTSLKVSYIRPYSLRCCAIGLSKTDDRHHGRDDQHHQILPRHESTSSPICGRLRGTTVLPVCAFYRLSCETSQPWGMLAWIDPSAPSASRAYRIA